MKIKKLNFITGVGRNIFATFFSNHQASKSKFLCQKMGFAKKWSSPKKGEQIIRLGWGREILG